MSHALSFNCEATGAPCTSATPADKYPLKESDMPLFFPSWERALARAWADKIGADTWSRLCAASRATDEVDAVFKLAVDMSRGFPDSPLGRMHEDVIFGKARIARGPPPPVRPSSAFVLAAFSVARGAACLAEVETKATESRRSAMGPGAAGSVGADHGQRRCGIYALDDTRRARTAACIFDACVDWIWADLKPAEHDVGGLRAWANVPVHRRDWTDAINRLHIDIDCRPGVPIEEVWALRSVLMGLPVQSGGASRRGGGRRKQSAPHTNVAPVAADVSGGGAAGQRPIRRPHTGPTPAVDLDPTPAGAAPEEGVLADMLELLHMADRTVPSAPGVADELSMATPVDGDHIEVVSHLFDASTRQRWPSAGDSRGCTRARVLASSCPLLCDAIKRGWPQGIQQSACKATFDKIVKASFGNDDVPPRGDCTRPPVDGAGARSAPSSTVFGDGCMWNVVRAWWIDTISGNWSCMLPSCNWTMRTRLRIGRARNGDILDWKASVCPVGAPVAPNGNERERPHHARRERAFVEIIPFVASIQCAVVEAVRAMPPFRAFLLSESQWEQYEKAAHRFSLAARNMWASTSTSTVACTPVHAVDTKAHRALASRLSSIVPRGTNAYTWLPFVCLSLRAHGIRSAMLVRLDEADLVECIECIPELVRLAHAANLERARVDVRAQPRRSKWQSRRSTTAAATAGKARRGHESGRAHGDDGTTDTLLACNDKTLRISTGIAVAAVCAIAVQTETDDEVAATIVFNAVTDVYTSATNPRSCVSDMVEVLKRSHPRAAAAFAAVCGIWERALVVRSGPLDAMTTASQILARTARVGDTSFGRDDWLLICAICRGTHTVSMPMAHQIGRVPWWNGGASGPSVRRGGHARGGRRSATLLRVTKSGRFGGAGAGSARHPAKRGKYTRNGDADDDSADDESAGVPAGAAGERLNCLRRKVGFAEVSVDFFTRKMYCNQKAIVKREAAGKPFPLSLRRLHPLPLTGRIYYFAGVCYMLCPSCGISFVPCWETGPYWDGWLPICDVCAIEIADSCTKHPM